MTPKDTISQLVHEATQLRNQAKQALSMGIHADEAPIVGGLLVEVFAPYGTKGLARGVGKSIRKVSRSNSSAQWRQEGDRFLSRCESVVKDMSVNTHNLPFTGNSSRLVGKFNRARRLKNPVPFFDTLIIVLQEIQNQDLIWNKDILKELACRKEIAQQERMEKVKLQSESRTITRLAKTVNLFDRFSISQHLRQFPAVQQSILGALNRLRTNDPDAERHCITSCRIAIESMCIELSKCGDWKAGLCKIFPSETDQRQVKGVWNYLSGKGAHGGHIPTKEEAEYALKITIATLEQIINKRSG